MRFDAVRILRTSHSERFVLQQDGRDVAGVDLHYLHDGIVAGTVSVFQDSGLTEKQVPELLTHIDDALLPEARIAEGNVHFTVIMGRVIGSFSAAADMEGNPTNGTS